jgi:hypothetical protein
VKKALFAIGAESIRAGFLYHEAMVLFPCCVQRCFKHTFSIKFISAMLLMFIACCKGFISCSKPEVGNPYVRI